MLFFYTPAMSILAIYVLAAILPAIFLMVIIYKQDKIEKEPGYLLGKLVIGGILSALCSIVLEGIGTTVLNASVSEDDPKYYIFMAFLVVAVVEEGTKLFFLKKRSWNDPNFNFLFDAIVYAVFVSLGFAAFENVEYVFQYGLSVALPRAVLSIPGHMGFAVFMGIFYGRAKMYANEGHDGRAKVSMAAALILPVLLHGFYDSCAMINNSFTSIAFFAFVIVMYIVVIALVKKSSRNDKPI